MLRRVSDLPRVQGGFKRSLIRNLKDFLGGRFMSDNTKQNDVLSPLALRPREAAKALGISPRLLWQLTKDGHIPCVRVGEGKRKTVLYPLADLQVWLSQKANAPKGGENDPR